MTTTPRRTWTFLLGTLAFTFALQLPALLATFGVLRSPVERWVGLAALGGFGPIVVAMLLSRGQPGGVRGLFARLKIRPIRAGWLAVALFGFPALWLAGTAVHRALGGVDAGPWLYPPENAQQVAVMFLLPFCEEVGWRGFALPRLLERHAPLTASLILGVVWAAWHTMMFLLQGDTAFTFSVSVVLIVAGSVMFGWLYRHTHGSLLVAVVAHVGVHLNNPTHALPGHVAPYVVYTAALVVAAVLLVAVDRRAWQRAWPE